ncbi:glutathione S-transferase [Plectosphaerella cucumerina]|uniref:Glutathione S-transferase n=1 Tax=Plectosphaerella cucumerina TaxID=40658 RepID=A0A8K0TB95_9PEZI|nr:glutathione S-transferase [Plectosphaerella cucumerina]
MTSTTDNPQVVFYHYTFSPYAKRVAWYLTLRGIPYSQCLQPTLMPRPDLELLGINHRRIPLMAIDKDIYVDTRLILAKLETLFPDRPKLGAPASSADKVALEHLLQMFTTESGLFTAAASLLPKDLPGLDQKAFFRDRAEFFYGNKDDPHRPPQKPAPKRPEAENTVEAAMDFLENGLLSDGRQWILGGEGPSLAEIHTIWPFIWLASMPGALPSNRFNKERFPLVFSWMDRFRREVAQAKASGPKPGDLKGEAAADLIASRPFEKAHKTTEEFDTERVHAGLEIGDQVTVWPADTGSSHKDTGKLVSLTMQEAVIEINGSKGSVRLHTPRRGFKLVKGTPAQREQKL